MTCKHCGTDIAANALVCYRCGTATVTARVTPPADSSLLARPRSSRVGPVTAVVLVLLLAAIGVWMWLR